MRDLATFVDVRLPIYVSERTGSSACDVAHTFLLGFLDNDFESGGRRLRNCGISWYKPHAAAGEILISTQKDDEYTLLTRHQTGH